MISIGTKRLAAALATALPLLSSAADWPQWRGPERTGYVVKDAVPATLPAEPAVLWRVKCGEGFASPIIAGGKVFYADNVEMKETLHALDAASGRELWRETVGDANGDKQGPPGPRCTPLVNDGRVYSQSSNGELQCRAAPSGKLLWHASYTADFGAVFIGESGQAQGASRHGNNGSPVIDGSHLIALVGGTNGAGVVCFDKAAGKVIWKSQNDQAAYAAPIVTTLQGVRQVVAFTCESVLGLDVRDGRLLWRVPVKTTFSRHVTTPVVVGDLVIVASHEFGLLATKVTRDGGEWKAAQAWISKEAAMNFSSPVVVGQHLYGLGPQKNIICVDAQTGKVAWSKDGWMTSDRGKAQASFMVLDKNILLLTDAGQLILFAADPTECKEISRAQVCANTWSSAAYAGGRLYLRDGIKAGGEVLAVQLLVK